MRVILVATLLLTPLAGCLSDEPTSSVPEAVEGPYGAYPLPADVQATSASAQVDGEDAELAPVVHRDDWYVLQATASAIGAVEAYALPVPEGSSVPAWYNAETRRPIIEFAFLDQPELEAWALLLVDLDSGSVVSIVSGFPSDGISGVGASAAMPSGSRSMGTGSAADYVHLDGVRDGARLGIVLAAKGAGVADVGIRFAAEDPWSGSDFTWPSRDVAEFRDRTSGVTWMPGHTGSAEGLELDMFYDRESLVVPGAARYVVGNMQVDEVVPDAAIPQPANYLEAHTETGSGTGFTATLGWSWTAMHAGSLEFAMQARDGEPMIREHFFAPAPIVEGMLVMSVGDGDGPSDATLRMMYAGAPGLFPKLTILDHLALGDSLENLLGVAVADAASSYSSSVTQETFDRSRLVIEGPLGTRVFQGMFPENATNL